MSKTQRQQFKNWKLKLNKFNPNLLNHKLNVLQKLKMKRKDKL